MTKIVPQFRGTLSHTDAFPGQIVWYKPTVWARQERGKNFHSWRMGQIVGVPFRDPFTKVWTVWILDMEGQYVLQCVLSSVRKA